jgi:hypothetical protein
MLGIGQGQASPLLLDLTSTFGNLHEQLGTLFTPILILRPQTLLHTRDVLSSQ